MIRVLSVASECVPLVKTGGLADVVGALPPALAPHGVEMRVLLPGVPAVLEGLEDGAPVLEEADLHGRPARLLAGRAGGFGVYALDAPHLFDRQGGLYADPQGRDWPDNPERFAGLCRMAVRLCREGHAGWQPQVLHAHDWQAGLAPYYLARQGRPTRSVMTVHNMAFHGRAAAGKLAELQLDPADFHRDGFEFWGDIDALKAGLVWSDRITTVSPTYARELTRPEFGAGLDGLMRARAHVLSGILNGIDTDLWNPATDAHLPHRYKTPRGKARNTAALRAELGLPAAAGPLCVVISRLSEQKGIDLLFDALPALIDRGGQLALLGTGAPELEARARDAARASPHVAVRIGYHEALAHRLIGGGDAILVPSRFEPCGLTQLYGLRYGTIPVVGMTGGLADTVIHASPAALAAGVATGLQITPLSVDSIALALGDLCALFADRTTWRNLQRNAMAQPVGWDRSAAAYAALYRDLTTAAA